MANMSRYTRYKEDKYTLSLIEANSLSEHHFSKEGMESVDRLTKRGLVEKVDGILRAVKKKT